MDLISREVAQTRLKEAKSIIQPYQYMNEALDVAIEALQQQPCDDCISRDEAIRVAEQFDNAIVMEVAE